MPVDISHFSMAGFAVDIAAADTMARSTALFLPACIDTDLGGGLSLCTIKDKSGGELRVALRRDPGGASRIVAMSPAFAGDGRALIEVAGDVSDPDYRTIEVGISAHFAGDQTPIVFELADPAEAAAFRPGAKLTIDVAAFGFDVRIYPDEKTYYAAQHGADQTPVFAANFFIPSGMFFESKGGAMPDGATRPVARADFAGTILAARLNTNALGKGQFWNATVKTYDDAVFDVLLDPRQVDAALKPGEIIAGRFWLSAHLVPR